MSEGVQQVPADASLGKDGHRPPAAFAQAWQAHLACLLDQASVDLPGWGPITIADLDGGLAWRLYELAIRARQDAIDHAIATPADCVTLTYSPSRWPSASMNASSHARHCTADMPST